MPNRKHEASLHQRTVLKALTEEIFSQDAIIRYELGSVPSAQSPLPQTSPSKLQRMGIPAHDVPIFPILCLEKTEIFVPKFTKSICKE